VATCSASEAEAFFRCTAELKSSTDIPCAPRIYRYMPVSGDALQRCSGCQDICVDQSDEVVRSTESGIDVVVAGRHHIPELEQMLSAAFHRAAALGCQQWWDPFPVEVLEDSVLRGETYVAVERGALLGTFALSWGDPMFWGGRPPDSGYLHRLCTNPDIGRASGSRCSPGRT
jgi:hypothetical protein